MELVFKIVELDTMHLWDTVLLVINHVSTALWFLPNALNAQLDTSNPTVTVSLDVQALNIMISQPNNVLLATHPVKHALLKTSVQLVQIQISNLFKVNVYHASILVLHAQATASAQHV